MSFDLENDDDDRAEAWLFICRKPGTSCAFASIDKDDTSWWPVDQWTHVERWALGKIGPGEILREGKPRIYHGLEKNGVPKKCLWEAVEDVTFKPGCCEESWHLPPGRDLYEFCPFCGGKVEIDQSPVSS